MKLSDILPKHLPNYDYKIINEQPFDTLGLFVSNTGGTKCTFAVEKGYAEDVPDDVNIVITTEELADLFTAKGKGVCIVDDPRVFYFRLHNALSKTEEYTRKRFKTRIGKNCTIHESAIIPEWNVIIGDNVQIYEYVVIRENVQIGNNTIIRSGVKIGEPDYEFKYENGKIFGVEHCGGVIIGNNVEILSNTGINRGLYPWDNTIIGDYCKIDMLCLISHGAKIGENTMIVGQSGIGGRVEVGNNCWIGFSTTIRNGITIGDNARVNMGAVVSQSVDSGQAVTGNFAIDHKSFMEDLKNKR